MTILFGLYHFYKPQQLHRYFFRRKIWLQIVSCKSMGTEVDVLSTGQVSTATSFRVPFARLHDKKFGDSSTQCWKLMQGHIYTNFALCKCNVVSNGFPNEALMDDNQRMISHMCTTHVACTRGATVAHVTIYITGSIGFLLKGTSTSSLNKWKYNQMCLIFFQRKRLHPK